MLGNVLIKKIDNSSIVVDANDGLRVTYADENFYLLLKMNKETFEKIFENRILNIISTYARFNFQKEMIENYSIKVFDLDIYSPGTGKLSLSVIANPINNFMDYSNIKYSKSENHMLYHFTIFNKDIMYVKFEEMKTENNLQSRFFKLRNICTYIIEKDTYKILYYNDLLKKIIPKLKIGDVCYKVKGLDKPCENCYLNKPYTYTSDFLSNGDEDWIITTDSIIWNDSKDAYVIYGKNAIYNSAEFNTKDYLTSSPTFTNFKAKYKNLIVDKSKNYSIVSLDIEKFKYINNIWGIIVGDEILKNISKNIAKFINKNEAYCRFYDDKFIILIRHTTYKDLNNRLLDLKLVLENMKQEYFKYMAINIIYGAVDIKNNTALETLIDMANIAKLSIKGNNYINFRIYDEELQKKFFNQSFIEERLENAVNNNEFIPYIQPKFNLVTGEIYGAEALVRWQATDRMIYPDEFIPLFEQNGFITTLDFIIYKSIFKFIRSSIDKGIKLVPISLNASREHVLENDKDFIDKLFKLVDLYKIPLNLIEIEITENAFMGDNNLLKNFVDNLRLKGIKVSIDDFGSAYSSLNSLKDIDVDIIKLDKAFLSQFESINITKLAEKDKIIVSNVVRLTKELKLSVICEGIETEEQRAFLVEIGCEYGQGYLFSKPITLEDFQENYLKDRF